MSGELTQISLKVSAPGKVIINGEHSVVYNKLAIAASIDLRTTVHLQETNSKELEITFEDLNCQEKFPIQDIQNIIKSTEITELLENIDFSNPENINYEKIIKIITLKLQLNKEKCAKNLVSLSAVLFLFICMLHVNKIKVVPLKIQVKTCLTIASGTGSSASLMVATTGSLLQYIKLKNNQSQNNFNENDLKIIQNWSFLGEKIFHGTPSGIDNTVITYGSVLSYRKNRKPIPVKMAAISAILINTNVEKNTKRMVSNVANLRTRRTQVVDAVLDAMDSIANDSLEVLMKLGNQQLTSEEMDNCYDELLELFKLNHNLLNTLTVGHKQLDTACSILWSQNHPCKTTGAGGGGLALALLRPGASVEDLHPELTKHGLEVQKINLACEGVRVD